MEVKYPPPSHRSDKVSSVISSRSPAYQKQPTDFYFLLQEMAGCGTAYQRDNTRVKGKKEDGVLAA